MAQEATNESPEKTEGGEGEDGPKPEPTPTATEQGQEPSKPEGRFDAEYVRQLRSEAAANRKRAQEAEAKVEEYSERDKTELEKAQSKVKKAEDRAAELEAKLLRHDVATEKQVPQKLVPLLTAATREDLEAQADLILDNAKAEEPAAEFDGGAREPAEPPKDPATAHNELLVKLFEGGELK
jgi:hypothetical protein